MNECCSVCAGVRAARAPDVRPLSRVRPGLDVDHSDEERRPRDAFHVDDAARPPSQRRRRRTVRAHRQLRASVVDHRRRSIQLYDDERRRQRPSDRRHVLQTYRLVVVSRHLCIHSPRSTGRQRCLRLTLPSRRRSLRVARGSKFQDPTRPDPLIFPAS